MPILVSGVLLAVVVARVSLDRLADEAANLNWPALVALTTAFVLALYFADAACLRWLFAQPDLRMTYAAALHARGYSYLFSALNYGLGQAALAWKLSSLQRIPLIGSLGRLAVLVCHDLVVLLTIGLVASLFSSNPAVQAVRVFCMSALGVVGVGVAIVCSLPQTLRDRLRTTKWGVLFSWWTAGRSLRLCAIRSGYYSIVLVYVTIGLAICRLDVDTRIICSSVPLVVVVDGLPISMSGLGVREAALKTLLDLPDETTVVAFSLVWSAGIIIGRSLLGLGHWWLHCIWPYGRPHYDRD